jgi:hypothetical protein
MRVLIANPVDPAEKQELVVSGGAPLIVGTAHTKVSLHSPARATAKSWAGASVRNRRLACAALSFGVAACSRAGHSSIVRAAVVP